MKLHEDGTPKQFDLSYRQAMQIQADQLVYYSNGLSSEQALELMQKLEAETKPYDGDHTEPISIFTINKLVPRGTWFERKDNMKLMHPELFQETKKEEATE